MRRSTVLVAVLLASSCVSPAVPPPTPPPRVVSVPPPPAPLPITGDDWRDWPLTPGSWSYRQDARGSIALFGQGGSDARVTLRCDRAGRQLYLSVAGAAATPLTVRTSSVTRALNLQPTGGTPAYAAATFAPSDPLLDAMGFSRGRFVLAQAGTPPLVIPAYAEIERVTEDCRG